MTRRFGMRAWLLIWVLALAPTPVRGQAPDAGSTLLGRLRDAATGQPVTRGTVCVGDPPLPGQRARRCAPTDSSGAFRLGGVPAGPQRITAVCDTRAIPGRTLGHWTVTLPADSLRQDWRVDARGCSRRVVGVFRGFYMPGFESSAFVPCPADAWFLPSDSLTHPSDRRAWVAWPTRAMRNAIAWPEVPGDAIGRARYFVEWRGTIEGPGHYGHMGISPFRFDVDSVLRVREPSTHDC